jgi:hypothetical protein
MIKLNKDHLTSIVSENLALFSNFPVVGNYCDTKHLPQSSEAYLKLIQQIQENEGLKNIIKQCLQCDFEIDTSVYEISTGFELASLIKNNSIEISEGEDTWISNLQRIKNALDAGACCSTRRSLANESDSCYTDLINQCDSNWIFIKNLKKFLKVDTIIFKTPNDKEKNV